MRHVPNCAPLALGVIISTALMAAAGGAILAAGGPAAAAVHSSATPCTDTWTGKATSPQWTIAKNWSNGVPVASSDVCITSTGADVLTSVSIKIHSLQLGAAEGIALEGSATNHITAKVATFINLTPGELSRIDMTDATIDAAQINDQGGTIFTDGPCDLNSPDVILAQGAKMEAANGTTTLEGLPQLSNGTLTGASLNTESNNTTFVVPGDITHLVSSTITLSAGSAIEDPQGNNALTGLTSVDAQSSLQDESNLTLTGSSFTADGNVAFGGTVAVGGPYTQAGGTLAISGNAVLSATPVTIAQGAVLFGSGLITGDLVNDGTAQAFGGTAQVTGNYTQGAQAVLDSGFGGLLAVNGRAKLAGEASSVEEAAQPGDDSPLITFGSLSGNFTGHNLGIKLFTRPDEIDALILPQIAASPKAVAHGGQLTVNGASFTLGASVRIFLDHANGTPLATTTAGYGGRFAVTVTIPASAQAGHHTLIAVGSDRSRAQTGISVS
jgi:hypothetical protein